MSHNLTPFVLGVFRNFRKYIYIDKVYTHEKLRNIHKYIFYVAQSNTILSRCPVHSFDIKSLNRLGRASITNTIFQKRCPLNSDTLPLNPLKGQKEKKVDFFFSLCFYTFLQNLYSDRDVAIQKNGLNKKGFSEHAEYFLNFV